MRKKNRELEEFLFATSEFSRLRALGWVKINTAEYRHARKSRCSLKSIGAAGGRRAPRGKVKSKNSTTGSYVRDLRRFNIFGMEEKRTRDSPNFPFFNVTHVFDVFFNDEPRECVTFAREVCALGNVLPATNRTRDSLARNPYRACANYQQFSSTLIFPFPVQPAIIPRK